MPPTLTGVLFDLDDTLVDTRGAFDVTMRLMAGEYLPHLDEAGLVAMVQHWSTDPGGHYRAYTRGEISMVEQRHRRVIDMQRAFGGASLDFAALEVWRSAFDERFASSWRLKPYALEVIASLGAMQIPCGIVSNASSALQLHKMRNTGLYGLIDLLVTVDTFGVGKPAPEVFIEGARLLGSEPACTVYLGDELDFDAVGASQAGLLGVWMPRETAHQQEALTKANMGPDLGKCDQWLATVEDLRDFEALMVLLRS